MSGFFERAFGLALREPELLLLALLVPVAFLVALRGRAPAILFAPAALLRRRRRPAGEPGRAPNDERLPGSWRLSLLWLPAALYAVGLLVVVVALARPAARVALPIEKEGIDILLLLDTSSSMTTNDLDRHRTRLEVAKDAAAAFVGGREDDRIGLLTFARYTDLRCPPTRDRDALTRILADVETVESDSAEDATGIGSALARAAQILGPSDAPSRVVILLTDGEENVALEGVGGEIAPTHAAQLCERLGVRVYTIVAGVGRRDPSGAWVTLDTRAVEHVAKRTGGAFHEAKNANAMKEVYARIDALEKTPTEEPRYGFEDRFLVFLAAALALLIGARLLQSTVFEVLP